MLSLTRGHRTWLWSIVLVDGERPKTTFHAGCESACTDEKVYTDSFTIRGIEAKDVWFSVSDNAFLSMNKGAGLWSDSSGRCWARTNRQNWRYTKHSKSRVFWKAICTSLRSSRARAHNSTRDTLTTRDFSGSHGWASVSPRQMYWKTYVKHQSEWVHGDYRHGYNNPCGE